MSEDSGFASQYRLRFDSDGRLTLPAELFAQAGTGTSHEAKANLESPGRVVLDPLVLLAVFQAQIRKDLQESDHNRDLCDELIAERSADSLSD